MKKILYIDMDNVLVDFKSWIDQLDNETIKKYEWKLDEVPHIFSLMIPLENSLESYNELCNYFDVYILSYITLGKSNCLAR
jgi:5'(3')-deoxyribonucleotidase